MRHLLAVATSLILSFFLAHLVPVYAQEVTCFAPDGVTIAPNDSFVPCNKLGITQRGVFSSCCRLDGPVDDRDLCAASGLCINGGIVRREFCTDPTWMSPACVKICDDPQWAGVNNGSAELTPCTDGTFCCGHNNLTCCGTQWAITVPTQVSVNGVNTTTTATVTATPEAISAGPGIAAVAGLGIGLGVVMLVAAGVIFCLRRRNQLLKKTNADLSATIAAAQTGVPPPGASLADHTSFRPASYMPGSSVPTMIAPSSHVPSMQEFAAFKAMYGNALAYQQAQEMAGTGPQRLSELDGNGQINAAAAAMRHLSGLGSPIPYEQMREMMREGQPQVAPGGGMGDVALGQTTTQQGQQPAMGQQGGALGAPTIPPQHFG